MDSSPLERRIGAGSFARLLGEWRPAGGRGLAEALVDRVRLLVLDGRLPLHTRVPAERELAGALDVSRTTVATAYEGLRAAEVLRSRRGAGSWTTLPPRLRGTAVPMSPHGDRALFDLAHAALPAPAGPVRAAVAAAPPDRAAPRGGPRYPQRGLPVLPAALAARLTPRGLPTTPDQVLVTAGAQHAIGLALHTVTGPGDRVLVEHPTYPNALDAIRIRGARPVPVPMGPGPHGTGSWDLDLLTASVRDAAPRLAYLVPDFQNPTGGVLDDADRERVVELARRTGTTVVVDETLSELALHRDPPRPLAAHRGGDSPLVLTVGSASKILWSGLRIGWIRTSAPMVRRLAATRAATDLGGAVLEQLVAARLLAEIEAIAATRRAELAAAQEHLIGRLAARLPAWRPSRPDGGLSLWVDLGEPVSSRLVGAARRHDVLLAAGPRFGLDGAFERYLRVPYTLPHDQVEPAVARLATAWRDLDGAAAAGDTDPVAVA